MKLKGNNSLFQTRKARLAAVTFLALALGVSFGLLTNWQKRVSAQENRSVNSPDETDAQLAAVIRRLTNRSTENLVPQLTDDGGVTIDLQGGFQNVMLGKIEIDGEPAAACVTSVGEANAFFGKNLETGEILASEARRRDETAKAAARHGMPVEEFEFYKKLIAEASERRAANPDAATITIVNNDGAGEGFNDPTAATPEGNNNGTTRGEQRLNLFNFAAGVWGAYLDSTVTTNIRSQFDPQTPCSPQTGGVLGSAGTINIHRNFSNAQFTDTWYHASLANKRSGTDLNPANPEINATFNSDIDNGCLGAGSRFYYGLNNTTPSNRINLLIVLLHEMGHGFGFSSFANGNTGVLFNGFPDIYTRYMFDRTTNKYWYLMTDAERQASALNTNNVFWDGASTKIASGFLTNGRDAANGRVALYTPNPFEGGSSVSHWSTATSPNLLMEPNINLNLPTTLDLTRQFMRDIGWYRDSNADGTPDSITNVTPSGGNLIIGSTVNITWTNTGGFNRNVTVELSTDGGATFPTTLAADIANNGTLSFTVPNTPTTQGKIRVREVDFADPAGVSAASFTIGTTVAPIRTKYDFEGDGKADFVVFRDGQWLVNRSSGGFVGAQWGLGTDQLTPGDFDNDGKSEYATYRSNATFGTNFYVVLSSVPQFRGANWGAPGDIARIGDFDGDGTDDLSVYRPSTNTYFALPTSGGATIIEQLGQTGDIPVVLKYDADAKTDFGVYRPSTGQWFIRQSTNGVLIGITFGQAGDVLVPADYDNDNLEDLAVFRNGSWIIRRSSNGQLMTTSFGLGTDIPVPGDYDGDGQDDLAVFRNGTWFVQRSRDGFLAVGWGQSGDVPLPTANTYVQ